MSKFTLPQPPPPLPSIGTNQSIQQTSLGVPRYIPMIERYYAPSTDVRVNSYTGETQALGTFLKDILLYFPSDVGQSILTKGVYQIDTVKDITIIKTDNYTVFLPLTENYDGRWQTYNTTDLYEFDHHYNLNIFHLIVVDNSLIYLRINYITSFVTSDGEEILTSDDEIFTLFPSHTQINITSFVTSEGEEILTSDDEIFTPFPLLTQIILTSFVTSDGEEILTSDDQIFTPFPLFVQGVPEFEIYRIDLSTKKREKIFPINDEHYEALTIILSQSISTVKVISASLSYNSFHRKIVSSIWLQDISGYNVPLFFTAQYKNGSISNVVIKLVNILPDIQGETFTTFYENEMTWGIYNAYGYTPLIMRENEQIKVI